MRYLDLNQLLTFKTIAEAKSLTIASQRLHKTQSAISIQLKKLEEQTGCTLIERGYHSAELTPEGEALLQYARKLLALSDDALNTLNPQDVTGIVRFGIPDDYASVFLLPSIQSFAKRFPGVKLQIRNDISQNLFTALQNDELDLALVTLRNSDSSGQILRRDQLYWVAEQSVELPSDATIPLALYPHGCGFRKNILDSLSEWQKSYEIAFECTGVTGVQIAVDSGLAITATCKPLIQPNWKILDCKAYDLPKLDGVVIELRTGSGEISQAQKYFADALREQVLST